MPARIAGGRVAHAATTAAKSGSVGVGRVEGVAGGTGGVGIPETAPMLPDLLPPDLETLVFPEGNRECSDPSGGISIVAGTDARARLAGPFCVLEGGGSTGGSAGGFPGESLGGSAGWSAAPADGCAVNLTAPPAWTPTRSPGGAARTPAPARPPRSASTMSSDRPGS